MKRSAYLWGIAVVALSFTACYTPQGRPDYTASGALAGGATGAIIGSMAHNSGAGTIVGGTLGTVVGSLIGHGMDQVQEAQLRAQAPQTLGRIEQSQPLTVADIQSLTKAGISDDLIISQIRNSRTIYRLTSIDIITLKNAEVSEKVIDYMINTPTQIPSAQVAGVVGPTAPPHPPQTIIVAPGPDYVWVGGTWLWLGSRWSWRPGYWHKPVHPHYRRHRR